MKLLFETKKIVEVEAGELVRSFDIATGADEFQYVKQTMRPIVPHSVQIGVRFDDDAVLITSRTHPILRRQGATWDYIDTGRLEIGDLCKPIGHEICRVTALFAPNYDTLFADMSVEKNENYYAGNAPDKLVVAHNSATLYYPIWHYEIESMLVLKNNKGIDENRVRHLDYAVQFNRLFYERLIQGGEITLFSPHDVPEMYEAFFTDYEAFKELYETAERTTRLRKKRVKALDLFSSFVNERKDTGRIYLMNVDNANLHSSFDETVAPVRMSNLCTEICLNTTPMGTIRTEHQTVVTDTLAALMIQANAEDRVVKVLDTNPETTDIEITEDAGRIALCTLSAINWGVVKDIDSFERIGRLTVRALDNLLDYQHYPVLAARKHTEEYRPLGVGIINFAYFLAKNGVNYSDGSGLALVDEWAEAWSYYLIKASVELAKERGPCKLFRNTKYANGIVPIDTRKREVDELVPHRERMDWQGLRADLREYGPRNATVMALMPAETSAQIANGTNGIEAPRSLVSVKQSKHGVLKQVVPESRRLKHKYELLWDQTSPRGYLQLCGVLQKYIDQSISVNTSYNPKFYEEEKIPMSELLEDILLAYRWGLKTLYYNNTNDGQGEIDVGAVSKVEVGTLKVDIKDGIPSSSVVTIANEITSRTFMEQCDACTI